MKFHTHYRLIAFILAWAPFGYAYAETPQNGATTEQANSANGGTADITSGLSTGNSAGSGTNAKPNPLLDRSSNHEVSNTQTNGATTTGDQLASQQQQRVDEPQSGLPTYAWALIALAVIAGVGFSVRLGNPKREV